MNIPHLDCSFLPEILRAGVLRSLEQYLFAAQNCVPLDNTELIAQLPRVWATSEFISRICITTPKVFLELSESGDLNRVYEIGEYQRRIAAALTGVANESALIVVLREIRRREMLRIAWRDLAGISTYETTVSELSAFADAILGATLDHLTPWLERDFGVPYSPNGTRQGLIIVALGKLGAAELNFSSDIDLLLIYPEEGATQGRRSLTNSEFFIRLGQRLIKVLSTITPLGLVFRVDMRLRPFGESGPLAISFDALENYYQAHGREWERYALIRARAITGTPEQRENLLKLLRPFVYRRYLDYGALESLREMKELINTEVRRKGLSDNVKLGSGGIREVEFIVQVLQLTRGGRISELRDPRLLPVLATINRLNLLPDAVIRDLSTAYIFLRNVEHRLQEYSDQQTQTLPADELGRARLAFAMDYPNWEDFSAVLENHRTRVHEHFLRIFAPPPGVEPVADPKDDLQNLWRGLLDPERVAAVLAAWRMEPSVVETLARLRTSPAVRALSARGHDRLDRLMPLLLAAVGGACDPATALERLTIVLESIVRRTAYVALLVENPQALSQLVCLCIASPWITQQIARFPLLLDELLDPRTLYAPPRRAALADALRQTMARLPQNDLEAEMEALRHFRHSNTLRVAAADITGILPLMVVSDHLTELAEVILTETLELAWHDLVQKHGRPALLSNDPNAKGFAIIGYGKLGGIELGYGSDLDVVFLHDGDSTAPTDGVQSIATGVFFLRLAQRLIHFLTTPTPSGRLYEIDLRLRPSGASGLLVTSFAAYSHYQRHTAWTWEQQALVRARWIAGDATLGTAFREIRQEVLGRARAPEVLQREVREMRERMRTELGSKDPQQTFDLKQDRGGVADIEFLVQYAVLRYSHNYPELTVWSDNMRQLDSLSVLNLFSPATVSLLQNAYRYLRREIHHATLRGEKSRFGIETLDPQIDQYRRLVSDLWEKVFYLEN